MKKLFTLKEIKGMLNLKYAQQIGGLDDEVLEKEFKNFTITISTGKDKDLIGKWFYRYAVEIFDNTKRETIFWADSISDPKDIVKIVDEFCKNN